MELRKHILSSSLPGKSCNAPQNSNFPSVLDVYLTSLLSKMLLLNSAIGVTLFSFWAILYKTGNLEWCYELQLKLVLMTIVALLNFGGFKVLERYPELKKPILYLMAATMVFVFFECCLIAKPLGKLLSVGALIQVISLYQRFA